MTERAADSGTVANRTPINHAAARPAGKAPVSTPSLTASTHVGAALLGVAIALVAAAACAAIGLLLASAFFGTTGGIL